MVNYQGPRYLQRLVKTWDIPIFNRVTQLSYSFDKLKEVPLERRDVAVFSALEEISISQKGRQPAEETQWDVLKSAVPPCRLTSSTEQKRGMELDVAPARLFAGCSQ